jgi:hypothetical protein
MGRMDMNAPVVEVAREEAANQLLTGHGGN